MPNYFSTLGIPILLGREINDRDQPTSTRICVINEAFAKAFSACCNPLGMHITQVYGDQRNSFEIVGAGRDSRGNNLRGDIEHRYYLPASQPIFPQDGVSFAIRTAGEPTTVIAGLRRAILAADPNLPITVTRPLEDIIDDRIVQERLLAKLSIAFGMVGLLLCAIGLYGVLSYGIARRTNEIGIRKALGAQHATVMAMILCRKNGHPAALGSPDRRRFVVRSPASYPQPSLRPRKHRSTRLRRSHRGTHRSRTRRGGASR